MIFYISKTILNSLKLNDKDTISFIRSAANAWKRGLHIVLSEPAILFSIAKSNNISHRSQEIFKEILASNITEYTNYSKIPYKVIVSQTIAFKNKYELTPKEAEKFIETKSHLLLENFSDEPIYKLIAKYFSKHIGLSCNFCYHPINGNGGEISKCFKMQPKDTPCLCVVDSDRTAPNAKLKSKSTACKILMAKKPHKLSDYYIIPVHEKENIIPCDIIYDFKKKNGGITNAEECVLNLLCKDNRCFRYTDLKQGMTFVKLSKMHSEIKAYNFWKKRIPILSKHNTDINEECKKLNCSNCAKQAICKLQLIPKLSIKSHDVIKMIGDKYDNNYTSCHLWSLWRRIGRIICSWICSPPQIAAV